MTTSAVNRSAAAPSSSLGLLVVIVAVGGYILVALADGPKLPPDLVGVPRVGPRPVPRRPRRGPALRARRRRDPAPARRAAQRHRVRDDLAPRPRAWRGSKPVWVAVGVGVFVVTLAPRPRHACARAVPLHVRLARASAPCCCRSLRRIGRTINGARLWVAIGPLKFEPGEIAKVLLVVVLRGVPRRQARAARARAACASVGASCPSLRDLGPLAAGMGVAILVIGVREGPRLVAAVLRGVRRDALHGDRGAAAYLVGASSPRDRSVHRVPRVRSRAGARRHLDRSVEGRRQGNGLPDHPGPVRVRHPAGSPAPGSASAAPSSSRTRRPTSSSPRSARSSASSARSASSSGSCCSSAASFRIAADAVRPFSKLLRGRASRRSSGCRRSSSSAASPG